MHLNPNHPNILTDMQAAANGKDLRDGKRVRDVYNYGKEVVLASAKRHLIPRKSYPYTNERQVKRQQLQHRRKFRKQLINSADRFALQAETGA